MAETPPERHSLVPYSVFKELESFLALCKVNLSKDCQSVKQILKLFLKWQGVFDLNEGIPSGSQCQKWRNFCGIPKRGSKGDAFAAGSTLPCSSTQPKASLECLRKGNLVSFNPLFRFQSAGEVPFPLKPSYQSERLPVKRFRERFSGFRLQGFLASRQLPYSGFRRGCQCLSKKNISAIRLRRACPSPVWLPLRGSESLLWIPPRGEGCPVRLRRTLLAAIRLQDP